MASLRAGGAPANDRRGSPGQGPLATAPVSADAVRALFVAAHGCLRAVSEASARLGFVAIGFGPGRPAESPELAAAVVAGLQKANELLVEPLEPWEQAAHVALDFVTAVVAAPGRAFGEHSTAVEAALHEALHARFRLFPVLHAEPGAHAAADVLRYALSVTRPPPRELERDLRVEEAACIRAVNNDEEPTEADATFSVPEIVRRTGHSRTAVYQTLSRLRKRDPTICIDLGEGNRPRLLFLWRQDVRDAFSMSPKRDKKAPKKKSRRHKSQP